MLSGHEAKGTYACEYIDTGMLLLGVACGAHATVHAHVAVRAYTVSGESIINNGSGSTGRNLKSQFETPGSAKSFSIYPRWSIVGGR